MDVQSRCHISRTVELSVCGFLSFTHFINLHLLMLCNGVSLSVFQLTVTFALLLYCIIYC